jgi:TolA-binding protein
MKFLAGVSAALLLLFCAHAYAGNNDSVEKWLRELKAMIEKIVPQKTATQNTTAVSGVRSADERAGDAIYWRGKRENITESEFSEFKAALESAERGQKEDAIRKFREFLGRHPQSGLSEDARTTIEKLNKS